MFGKRPLSSCQRQPFSDAGMDALTRPMLVNQSTICIPVTISLNRISFRKVCKRSLECKGKTPMEMPTVL